MVGVWPGPTTGTTPPVAAHVLFPLALNMFRTRFEVVAAWRCRSEAAFAKIRVARRQIGTFPPCGHGLKGRQLKAMGCGASAEPSALSERSRAVQGILPVDPPREKDEGEPSTKADRMEDPKEAPPLGPDAPHVVLSTKFEEPWGTISRGLKEILVEKGCTVYNPNTDNKELGHALNAESVCMRRAFRHKGLGNSEVENCSKRSRRSTGTRRTPDGCAPSMRTW